MLLLRWTSNNGRLFGKYIAQYGQEVQDGGFIPICRPAGKVGMIDLTLRVDVLAGPHHDVLGRGHVDQGGLSGIGVGNPY